MIKATNLKKTFGKLEVLKGVDLLIHKGELVTIVGPSGAGKTTLIQILGSLMKPDQGAVEIAGIDLFSLKSSQLSEFRNKEIGFVFQFHHLLPEFTALENVIIPSLIASENRDSAIERAKELMDTLGILSRASHKPSELSGGEQQRVAIARALINSPSVIFADEPSGNLDTATRDEIHQLFFTLRDRFHQTIVIVTHDESLAKLSDRKIVMVDGLIR